MSTALRFGVWALVYGTWGAKQHPLEPVDASWARNRDQIVEAERLGFDATLVAQHEVNPSGDHYDQLEAWTASAALAAVTQNIEIITAIKPALYHPVVLAKQALQIEEISGGRFGINVVNAWFRPEIARAGLPFLEHDERYAYGREWLTVVDSLVRGERTTFHGKYFHVEDYQLKPAGRYRPRPAIYVGGESEPARALAADHADVWFVNGQPEEDVRRLVTDVARRPRSGTPARFGLAAFVIARDTARAAADELAYAFELAGRDTAETHSVLSNADPQAEMFKTFARHPHVGTNGGTAAGLVGSYDTVAERIVRFGSLGIELFMLQFQPFESEMRRFAEHVLPRVRRLEQRAA
ncbi:LLM class flavin-dependent oxidoreductase [Mycolicibacterium cosmeticum]|uniref:F420-dependent methylene-tetrahydromethanopterin reductase n=1 Tax=Mycolicibacterium cosmeticum TaxID=258533 RepID=W9B1W1_MYCCO|nr:LLM class flavin-dependent oxidoreductase [Mycolicibacterium cosmeticum]TLH68402.1 LLM class flavin-dependent oxidoreductase [Mycolicibacterium cosmeticum]CDO09117.1 F420-dependent methylene-tetrahydromethanopterin reductase [Mycolicibacterium cosmeticum]